MIVSDALPASASATLMPFSGACTPEVSDCAPGTVVTGGALPLVAPSTKSSTKPAPVLAACRSSVKVSARLVTGVKVPRSSTLLLK